MAADHGNSSLVLVEALEKHYGDVHAFRGITFEITKGEVFGLLGPNGAGKTAIIEILEGLRQADSGTVRVCGMDPERESAQLKQRIGAQL
jgi:ABC-2 type transport system ATP-binding protein